MPDDTNSFAALDYRAALAEKILVAIREYEARCDRHRRSESERIFGHPGAFIGSEAPTEAGRLSVIRNLLDEEARQHPLGAHSVPSSPDEES